MNFRFENVNSPFSGLIRTLLLVLILCSSSNGFSQPSDPGLYARFSVGEHSWVVELEFKKTPRTVANFVSLAEGLRPWLNVNNARIEEARFYDNTILHRIIADFMIQGGSPTGLGNGNPGYFFNDEFKDDLLHDGPGILSMANSGPNTNGSQFFITVKETPWLNGKHSVFGKVIEGMDSVLALSLVPTDGNNRPLSPQTIQKVEIIRVGEEAAAFGQDVLESPLPNIVPIVNTSLKNNDGVLRMSWTSENPVRYTLLWTRDYKSWRNLRLNTQSSIDLLVQLTGTGQLVPMQDFESNNFFMVYASDLEE